MLQLRQVSVALTLRHDGRRLTTALDAARLRARATDAELRDGGGLHTWHGNLATGRKWGMRYDTKTHRSVYLYGACRAEKGGGWGEGGHLRRGAAAASLQGRRTARARVGF